MGLALPGYRAVTSAYYRGAVGAMLVYDITKRQTFDHIPRWLEELRNHADKNMYHYDWIKCDLEDLTRVLQKTPRSFDTKGSDIFSGTSALDCQQNEQNGNPGNLAGKKIIVPGPAQVIPEKKMCCSS
ncbi:Ras-related protein Rab11D [Tanacetum coccineum]